MKIAVYPGSFDPVTLGHLNIIKRASKIFDKLIVLVGNNLSKHYWFNQHQRVALINSNLDGYSNVEVIPTQGLTVDAMKKINADIIVRGIRNSQDLIYERSVADINHHLNPKVETVFLLSRPKYQAISSSILKETFYFGGDISPFVSRNVLIAMDRVRNNDEEK